ncbi:hypothetical protein [Paraglaciecola hydrolytica]|uniref:TonB C-terminal domain-containing protein n=1 Tax=Paraglaciecola hydrolytica TaxID=1799789 RepID=A0A148KM27_9ALTE|nr:hypothetical protein [Paraglaciecola hydrolytica]KXI27298.1 hypothetical protein AX660_21465 [Paraglaciecola hydrolytica]
MTASMPLASPNPKNGRVASRLSTLLISAVSWSLAVVLALMFIALLLLLQQQVFEPESELLVRKVELALPPPPTPPPPIKMQQQEISPQTPSINVTGLGGGPTMNFASVPSLGLNNLEKVEQPKFDINTLSVRQSMSVDFPIIEMKNLDKRPRLVSSQYVQFPPSLIRKGVKNVHTKVQIIIDDKGNVYIKKITDPVYADMVDVIRMWVKNARFTVPTKNGLPVQAVYDYNLIFEYRI